MKINDYGCKCFTARALLALLTFLGYTTALAQPLDVRMNLALAAEFAHYTENSHRTGPAHDAEGLGIGHRSLDLHTPPLLSTYRLNVSQLQGSWSPAGQDWIITATLTDPADERLFKSVTDLTGMSQDMLRQTPSRHWWIGVQKKF
jgi:hypothetical protein